MIAGAVGLAPTTAAAAVETADFSPSETKEILGVDDFNWDSGWIPDGSPVQLRMILTAGNSITVEMPGEAFYDWDTGEIHFEGDPDAGLFAINVGVDLVAQVKLDVDAPWPLDDIQVETGDLPLVDLASANATFRDCTFSDGRWGGMRLNSAARPTVTDCAFEWIEGAPAVFGGPFEAVPGFTNNTVADCAGGNFMRVAEAVWK